MTLGVFGTLEVLKFAQYQLVDWQFFRRILTTLLVEAGVNIRKLKRHVDRATSNRCIRKYCVRNEDNTVGNEMFFTDTLCFLIFVYTF